LPDKQEALSSTEKLLELIRSPDTEPDALPELISEPVSENTSEKKESPNTFNFLKSAFSFRKKLSVGIDIGASSLKLVKIRQTAKSRPELLDSQVVPFDADMSAGNPHFHLFLKSALHGFCHSKTMDIWSAVSTAGVKIHYLKIPKV